MAQHEKIVLKKLCKISGISQNIKNTTMILYYIR